MNIHLTISEAVLIYTALKQYCATYDYAKGQTEVILFKIDVALADLQKLLDEPLD